MPLPNLHLISHDLCPYVQRAIIISIEKEIPHDRTYIDLANKPDWFRQISPLGKVPVLQVGDETLFESAVICEYLDEITPNSLHPVDPLEKAKHRAWIEFGSSILNVIAGFYNASDSDGFAQKRQDLLDKFTWVEQNLKQAPYFAGQTFSLVDAVYGPIFRYFDVFESIEDFDFFSKTPKVKIWRETLQKRPSIQQAVVDDYPDRLLAFLKRRNSYLSSLMP
jgi:glutathione S-transferase